MKKFVILLLALLFCPLLLSAQNIEEELPDEFNRVEVKEKAAALQVAATQVLQREEAGVEALEAGVTADSTGKKPNFIRRIFDYFDKSNVDRTFEKKIDWSIAPGPNYSSDVGFGIGFLVAGLYRLDRTDSVTSPSNISIYGNVTTQKFAMIRFSGDNHFKKNTQRLSYSGAVVYFPGAFYGIGYNAGKEGYVQELTTMMFNARAAYSYAVYKRLYVGAKIGLNYSGSDYTDSHMTEMLDRMKQNASAGYGAFEGMGKLPKKTQNTLTELYQLREEGRYDPDKQDPFSNFIEESGENPNAFNTHVGLFLQYDSRDVTFNAYKGIYLMAEAQWYPSFLGNTKRHFGRIAVTFDAYQRLWKGAVLAYDLYADFTIGTPSWHMYAKLGGMERMRGYYEGRYRDKRLVEMQLELRQNIYRRHGVVGWIGGGQVWGTDKFRWGNTLYSFGCGYRFEFKKRMNIRLDYGWGVFGNPNLPWDKKRSSAFLFTASEAF